MLQDSSSEEDYAFYEFQEMPLFKGKEASVGFKKYIYDNLIYPEKAKANKVEGIVYVQFYVDTMGYVHGTKVLRGVTPELDSAAINVVRNSPQWKPGLSHFKPMEVSFTFPIKFELPNTQNSQKMK